MNVNVPLLTLEGTVKTIYVIPNSETFATMEHACQKKQVTIALALRVSLVLTAPPTLMNVPASIVRMTLYVLMGLTISHAYANILGQAVIVKNMLICVNTKNRV